MDRVTFQYAAFEYERQPVKALSAGDQLTQYRSFSRCLNGGGCTQAKDDSNLVFIMYVLTIFTRVWFDADVYPKIGPAGFPRISKSRSIK